MINDNLYGGSSSAKRYKATYEETTALADHNPKDFIYLNNHYYKVTTAIRVGDPIAVGTNITANLGLTGDVDFYLSGIPGSDTESIFVLDTLDSTSTRDALSANQGRVLNLAKAERSDISSIVCTGSANTTGETIATGRYFYLNGALCKATADIANGATFTLNTNFAVVTIDEELNALNSKLANLVYYPTATKTTSAAGTLVTDIPFQGRILIGVRMADYSQVAEWYRAPEDSTKFGLKITDSSGNLVSNTSVSYIAVVYAV